MFAKVSLSRCFLFKTQRVFWGSGTFIPTSTAQSPQSLRPSARRPFLSSFGWPTTIFHPPWNSIPSGLLSATPSPRSYLPPARALSWILALSSISFPPLQPAISAQDANTAARIFLPFVTLSPFCKASALPTIKCFYLLNRVQQIAPWGCILFIFLAVFERFFTRF